MERGIFEIVDTESLVPEGHLLRKIDEAVDFNKIYDMVEPLYCADNGRPSVDPVVLFKMVLIQHLYGLGSLRRTAEEVSFNVYCDPQASWQKPHVEKNHVLLRRILPKGTSFKDLTKAQVALATSHINSVARELFDNQTPFDLFVGENEKKLLELLDLSPIAPDEVYLKPALLKTKPN